MENLYCTIFIVDVSQNPEEVDTITSRVLQLIEDHGGVVKRNNPWGKRRLAYPIENKTSGFYVELEFSANSRLNIPQIIEKEFRLNDRVMRFLTYVVTKEELKQREVSAKRLRAEGAEGEAKEKPESNGKEAPKAEARKEADAPKAEEAKKEADAPKAEEAKPADDAPKAEEATPAPAEAPAAEESGDDETKKSAPAAEEAPVSEETASTETEEGSDDEVK